ncbi:hypothetical protein D3C85_937370 [compost metagenome]
MIVLDKLEQALLAQFGGGDRPIHIITEPSNAMARREIRIIVTAQRLNNLDLMSDEVAFTPYELMLDLLISVRLSGGNSNKLLSGQAILHSTVLAEFLAKRLIVLTGVDEVLPDMSAELMPGWELKIVGDAELVQAKRLRSGFAGEQAGEEYEQHKTDLYTWREDWQASLAMTVHRVFPNPTLQHMTFINDNTGSAIEVPPQEA